MAMENESGVTVSVYPMRAHFLLATDTKALLRLLEPSLPMRCGCCYWPCCLCHSRCLPRTC